MSAIARRSTKKPPVLVIAHDAGGGEIIAAYVKKHKGKINFFSYVAGPAEKIFKREGLAYFSVPETRAGMKKLIGGLPSVSCLLVGTGWMTHIEKIALEEAKRSGLTTKVYLESWSGYRERFGFPTKGWKKNLPDEIWIGDKYALALAKKNFPKTNIRYIANEYFKNIRQRYNAKKNGGSSVSKILFLSNAAAGEEQVFQSLCEYVLQKKISPIIRIRFHPADNRSRYNQIITNFKGVVRIELSHEKDIVRDFLQARTVIGTETVAMAGAVMAGIRTISVAVPGKKFQLPFQKIIRVKKLDGKVGLI